MTTQTSQPPKFSGTIPRNYDQYMGPMFFEQYAIEIANRIDVSKVRTALEVSCGTGCVTNQIKKVLNATAKLTASDISPDMLAVAKEKFKDASIEWGQVDFKEIPFPDASLDLVVSSFGYMFADDKVKVFGEALRVLRPGGSLIMSTWDKLEYNEASNVFRQIVKKYFGESLPETYKLPYSMNDPAVIKEQLTQAGFSRVMIDVVNKQSTSDSAKSATIGMVQGGSLYNEIIKHNPAWIEEISGVVEKELSEKYGAAPMIAPMRALITQAWK